MRKLSIHFVSMSNRVAELKQRPRDEIQQPFYKWIPGGSPDSPFCVIITLKSNSLNIIVFWMW